MPAAALSAVHTHIGGPRRLGQQHRNSVEHLSTTKLRVKTLKIWIMSPKHKSVLLLPLFGYFIVIVLAQVLILSLRWGAGGAKRGASGAATPELAVMVFETGRGELCCQWSVRKPSRRRQSVVKAADLSLESVKPCAQSLHCSEVVSVASANLGRCQCRQGYMRRFATWPGRPACRDQRR